MNFDAVDVARLGELLGKKWCAYPANVLPAWVADMDFPVADPIRRFLGGVAERGEIGYPLDPDMDPLPAVFAARQAERFGWQVDPALIEIIGDVNQGMFIVADQFAASDEGIAIFTPIYPPFLDAVRLTGRRLVDCPLVRGAERYEIDFDQFEAAVDRSTRVLFLCNPHNPSGRVLEQDELERIAEVALRRNLVVVADEIHADLVFDGRRHIPFATLSPEVEARTITMTSATKAFNTAGLRCAIAAFGADTLRERFNRIPRRLRGGLGALVTTVTRIAWQECDDWLRDVLAYLESNRGLLTKFAAESLPGMRYFPPEATYLAWFDCSELGLAVEPRDFFLEHARVALSPGIEFGANGRDCVRLNFATSHAILTEILERMADALRRHG